MDFLLSINRNFYKNFNDEWIYLFLSYDINNKVSGCEFYVNMADEAEKKYVKSLIKNNFIKNWIFQFHGPDLTEYSKYDNNYLNMLYYYESFSQNTGKKIDVTIHPVATNTSFEDSITKTYEEFYKICNLVQKYNINVDILIENLNQMPNLYRCNVKHLDTLFEIPNLKFTWDIGHLIVDNEPPYCLSTTHINRLKNIHLHDTFNVEHYPFYNNKLFLEQFFKYLNQINYNGTIVAEIAIDYMKSEIFSDKLLEYTRNIHIVSYYYEKSKKSLA